jgi:hypothetical protein
MIPSYHESSKDPTSWNTLYGQLLLEGTTWNFRGTGADGKVRFTSRVDVTGAVSELHMASVGYCLASLYLLFSLKDESMGEAFESLYDVFFTQQSKLKVATHDPSPQFERTVRVKPTGAPW